MRNGNRAPGIAAALLLALALASSVTIGYSAAAVPGTQNPVPLVNSPLVPDSTAPGGPDFPLTVNGAGFVSASVVQWNGTGLATTFLSASKLTAIVPAADIASAGTASISVSNPAPGGGRSNVALFSVRVPFSAASFGQTVFQVGSSPNGVFAADLNNDGKVDLVASLGGTSEVTVSIGNGDGSFQDAVPYPVAGPAFGVVIADLNGDGHLDLAATTSAGSVSILLGNGDGTYQGHRDFSTGNQAEVLLTAGDFNADGKLDLAIVLSPGSVAILLGNGDGTFQSPVDYPVGANRAFGIVTGDFNRDGKLDLAVTILDGAVFVMLGNGDGTFQSATEWLTLSGSQALVAADFNGDGKLDLAVQTDFEWISVLLGNGDGSFSTHVDYKVQPSQYGLAAADMNGDGKLDLIIPTYHRGRIVTLLLGRGDGTFFRRSDFSTGNGSVPNTIAVGDFDGDGRLDIATVNDQNNTLSVLPQVTSVLSRTYLKFGSVKVGDSVKLKVTLSNIGSTSFTINNIVLAGQTEGYTETNNCGPSLAPGASCKITIVFTPTFPKTYKPAKVKVVTSAVNGPQKIYLQGTGTN